MSDRAVLRALLEAKELGKNCVLATIVNDRGSVPRHAGTKMLIYQNGEILGTIGGGEVENRVISRVPELLQSGIPELVHYNLNNPAEGDPGFCGGQMDIFLEPSVPDPSILVIGCGHVGQALVELAHWLGFYVVACDDREELCNAQTTPYADKYVVAYPERIADLVPIHTQTYIVAVTRNATLDAEILPPLLKTIAPYIGVIGSRRRWASTCKLLSEKGICADDLARVKSPVGLEINAETPHEIALSIMAEIVKQLRTVQNKITGLQEV
jgi:xanthine dehydrogenase accessory factor